MLGTCPGARRSAIVKGRQIIISVVILIIFGFGLLLPSMSLVIWVCIAFWVRRQRGAARGALSSGTAGRKGVWRKPGCEGSVNLPRCVENRLGEHIRGCTPMGFVGAPDQVHRRVVQVFGYPIDERVGNGALDRNTRLPQVIGMLGSSSCSTSRRRTYAP
jgi:hypothetical protein